MLFACTVINSHLLQIQRNHPASTHPPESNRMKAVTRSLICVVMYKYKYNDGWNRKAIFVVFIAVHNVGYNNDIDIYLVTLTYNLEMASRVVRAQGKLCTVLNLNLARLSVLELQTGRTPTDEQTNERALAFLLINVLIINNAGTQPRL